MPSGFSLDPLVQKNITLQGSFSHNWPIWERVLAMLASGQLNAKAKTKASSDGSYYPLAQFPEFTKAVEDSLAKKTAAVRKEDMNSLYKKVEKEQKNFYLKR